ncbi:MAG: efflux RND transporter periplasmic adaptor subunit [Phycisphaerales bacterium]
MTNRRASGVFLCLSLAAGTVAIASTAAQPASGAPAASTSKVVESAEWAQRAAAFGDLEWITRPSRDATMSFTLPVEIREIPAQPGQRVKAGDLLVRARDADIVAAVESQRVRVGNNGPVDAAKASVDSASTRYQRILEANGERATNQQEVDDRRVQLDAARAQLVNAENEHKEEVAKLKQLEESLARYRLQAPFDGVVESVVVDSGSSIEPPNPVLRIVNIDVLWIELPTPTDLTLSKDLKAGAPAWVLLDVPGGWVARGEVLYVSPVADAAAATRRVRVSLPNPKQLPPGTRARVRFDKPEGFVADGPLPQGGGVERVAASGPGVKK